MEDIIRYAQERTGMTDQELHMAVKASVDAIAGERKLHKVLLLPPDYTRFFSGAGTITALYYKNLETLCDEIDVMPAVGTHDAMTDREITEMFEGVIAPDKVIHHRWRDDVVKIGQIPGSVTEELSGGHLSGPIDVEINSRILDPSYDLILSIGQVVPHEVAGMANYSKNILVGCGGADMISKTHMIGALCGVGQVMGKQDTSVRRAFDYAEEHFLKQIPILYVLTVSGQYNGRNRIQGMFVGRDRRIFERASHLSLEKNVTYIGEPVSKIVAYMDPDQYKSTWVSNKALYRSRLALKPGGELIVIAPGVRKFGEDTENDRLIRRFGYDESFRIQGCIQDGGPLSGHLSAAAHLLQGNTDGKFKVIYAVSQLSKDEIEAVRYQYMPLQEALDRYDPVNKETGYYDTGNGETYYFIRHPAAGLWMAGDRPEQGES